MAYPYLIVLTEEQRTKLRDRVGSGVAPARMLIRARIRLKADCGEGGPVGPTRLGPGLRGPFQAPAPQLRRMRSTWERQMIGRSPSL